MLVSLLAAGLELHHVGVVVVQSHLVLLLDLLVDKVIVLEEVVVVLHLLSQHLIGLHQLGHLLVLHVQRVLALVLLEPSHILVLTLLLLLTHEPILLVGRSRLVHLVV